MTQTVLLAGASGMLGSRIAHHLVHGHEANVRLMLRDASSGSDEIDALKKRGAEIVEADLKDTEALDRATKGVDVIVSAVQGGPDVIVDGQVALAKAGQQNGARRILPSDYGLDLFKSTTGEHAAFDMRAEADRQIAALGLQQVNVLQGAFMEMFGPGMGTIDLDKGTVSFWGDGTQIIQCTRVEDTAAMIADAALDKGISAGKFAFAGDSISILGAAKAIEAQTGRTLTPKSYGSEADLRSAHAKALKDDPQKAVMFAYMLYMLTGQTALTDLQSHRYSDVVLKTFPQFVAKAFPANVAA